MVGTDRCHVEQLSLDQLDACAVGEHAGLDHALVLLDRQRVLSHEIGNGIHSVLRQRWFVFVLQPTTRRPGRPAQHAGSIIAFTD